jgi:hypothetical protein
MSQQRQAEDDRGMLVEMAAMWLRLADFADNCSGVDNVNHQNYGR